MWVIHSGLHSFPTICLNFIKLLYFSKPLFPHIYHGGNHDSNIYCLRSVSREIDSERGIFRQEVYCKHPDIHICEGVKETGLARGRR